MTILIIIFHLIIGLTGHRGENSPQWTICKFGHNRDLGAGGHRMENSAYGQTAFTEMALESGNTGE